MYLFLKAITVAGNKPVASAENLLIFFINNPVYYYSYNITELDLSWRNSRTRRRGEDLQEEAQGTPIHTILLSVS